MPRTAARLASDRGGSVLIEMSIVLLILVTLLIGVTELSQAMTLQRRVVNAAASAADLMTRAHRSLGVEDLTDLGPLLDEIVGRHDVEDADNNRLFGFKVTMFRVDATTNTKEANVTGSYVCDVESLPVPSVPDEIVREVGDGDRIVLVETQYRFTSSFTFIIRDAIMLGGSSFFIPRLDSDLNLSDELGCDGNPLPNTESTEPGT